MLKKIIVIFAFILFTSLFIASQIVADIDQPFFDSHE